VRATGYEVSWTHINFEVGTHFFQNLGINPDESPSKLSFDGFIFMIFHGWKRLHTIFLDPGNQPTGTFPLEKLWRVGCEKDRIFKDFQGQKRSIYSIFGQDMRVSIGDPHSWMVYFMDNPKIISG